MKVVQFHEYGSPDVLQLQDVDPPSFDSDDLLLDVHAASVNPVDWRYRKGQLKWYDWFSSFPRIPGSDVAGEVLETGSNVSKFDPGDEVFAMTHPLRSGTYAEQVSFPASNAAIIPDTLSMAEAASLPLVSLTSLQALRDLAHVKPEEHVLINGASGGVGITGIQIALSYGATVTGVCSYRNTEFVKSSGAKTVIDYTETDFADHSNEYDVVYDAFGNRSLDKVRNSLRPNGRYVTTDIRPARWLDVPLSRLRSGPTADVIVVKPIGDDLEEVGELVESDELKPVIDKTFPIEEAAQAHRYSESRRTRGKIILKIKK